MSSTGLSSRAFRGWQVLLHRVAKVAQATAVRSQASRVRPLWRLTYELLARTVGLFLTAGQPSASVYVAGGVADGDPVYGLSDIDLVVVTPGADQVRARWRRIRHALPPLGELFADMAVYFPAELKRAAGASTFTQAEGSVYLGRRWPRDERGLRERPGLRGATVDWRLLQGRDQRPAVPVMEPQRLRIAAWLELQFWWRVAMQFALKPMDHQAPYAALKLITHSARAWLAVEHGDFPDRRGAILAAARQRLPEEDEVLGYAATLAADVGRCRHARWDLVLPAFVRFSDRIAGSFETAATAAGCVEVRLSGVRQGIPLTLLDWRGLVLPERPDETLTPAQGDPGERTVLADAVRDSATGYRGLQSGRLLVLAAGEPWNRSFLRGVACSAGDPVSFALLAGADSAPFPSSPAGVSATWRGAPWRSTGAGSTSPARTACSTSERGSTAAKLDGRHRCGSPPSSSPRRGRWSLKNQSVSSRRGWR